jgi:putative ABC transport system substrate-binding protein
MTGSGGQIPLSGKTIKAETMSRLIFACFCLLPVVFPAATLTWAQPMKKLVRIGYLSPQTAARESRRAETVRSALSELGYIEGKNLVIDYRYAEGNRGRIAELAAELVRLKVDAIMVTGGDLFIRAAKNATSTIPIIMTGPGPDPVKAGFIESLAHPGGNVTGVTYLSTELGGKRLELLKEAFPKISRIAIFYDQDAPGTAREVKEDLPVAARALGLTIRSWEVRSTADFEGVFAALSKDRPDALYVPLTGALMRANAKRIAEFSLKARLPALYGIRDSVEAGGLMYYGADLDDIHRRAAVYVDKILKGAKPADLPVEQPTKFELVINLKTAKQIGLTIPPNVLARADRVIR